MNFTREILRRFGRSEDGSMIIFALFVFMVMIVIGGMATDIARYELTRSRLQSCSDRAVLAAADLDQSLEPRDVVNDYFAKCGLQEYLVSTEVEQALNYKKVTVSSEMGLGTFFLKMVGVDRLEAPALASATESVDDIEISLVLDISGSMAGSKIRELRNAAATFVEEVYAKSAPDSVSVSIVPYSTQVSMPAWFADGLNFGRQHPYSSCVTFEGSDYGSTALEQATPLRQTLHYDPFSRATRFGSYDYPRFVCQQEDSAQILPLETSLSALKYKISQLQDSDNTSIEIGVKWGAALLDPSLQGNIATLAGEGYLDPMVADRPLGYGESQALKIMVVMTDGENVGSKVPDYKLPTMSDVFIDEDGTYWPAMDVDDDGELEYHGPLAAQDCRWRWSWLNGFYWSCSSNEVNGWQEFDNLQDDDGFILERMTYAEVLNQVSWDYFVDNIWWVSNEKQWYYRNLMNTPSKTTKDNRLHDICTASKDKGTIIYTVGFELYGDSALNVMADCASSPSHFFRTYGDELTTAFENIARQINQLKLTL